MGTSAQPATQHGTKRGFVDKEVLFAVYVYIQKTRIKLVLLGAAEEMCVV